MNSIDPTSLLIGFLLALVIAVVAVILALRHGRADGYAQGRLSREGDLATGVAERDSLRHELAQANAEVDRLRGLTDELRAHGERIGNERAALAVRAERVTVMDQELVQLRQKQGDGAQTIAELRARNEEQQQAAVARGERVTSLEQELATWRQRHDEGAQIIAELRARIEEQQQAAAGRLRELEGARERMKAEFQALANEILEDKARRFSERSNEQLGHLLNPLREQIGDFRKAVNDAYEKEGHARIALQTEVQQLRELNLSLNQEARNLTRALSSDSRSQGYWGELKLERLLEMAALEKGSQYRTQESFRDGDGDLYRPDAVLLLPGGRDIVIDAKVTLTDYQRASTSEDPDERERYLGQHVAALRRHVVQLGQKDYSRLEGLSAPDLVFLFVPVEGAFLEALRRDPSLYDDAHKRRIILVGPSNLLASLRLVAQIWRTEDQNRNAQLIADKAGAMYDKFVGFVDDLTKLGDHLDRAVRAQQAALGKLARGKGNLVRRAEDLRQLGVAPGKQLPSTLLDQSEAGTGNGANSGPADAGNDEGADDSAPSSG